MDGRVWVVTGCSAGFGKEICISALARGDKVIATCRGNAQERLKDLVARGAVALSLDVTAPADKIKTFARNAIGIYGRIDIVCNNAGYVHQGAFEETSPDEMLREYQTVVFGPLNITQAFLPHLRERKSGVIAMIGSRSGAFYGPVPGCGVYTSAKAALAALTSTLAAELEPFNIKATCIEPGDFRTEVFISPVKSDAHLSEYETVTGPTFKWLGPGFQQPGDPHKGAERIIDLLTGEGHAKGKCLPDRVALGDDAYESKKERLEIWEKEMLEWKEWTTGTDY